MNTEQLSNIINNPVCIGTGLVALDVVISSNTNLPAQLLTGGSCGNVVTILSYLGWDSFPIARLSNNGATELLLHDFQRWNVNDDLLTFTEDGSTPIIIHRILKDKNGAAKHKFEFRNPEDGTYLPSYKPCLAKSVKEIVSKSLTPRVFYFDRINRASIDLAKAYKEKGAVIFFEPSSVKDIRGFSECIKIADVLKFSEDRISDFDDLYPIGQSPLEIQTLGEIGLKFRRKGNSSWQYIPSFSIDNIIDSAGAGDWCSAGIIMTLFKTNKKLDTINDAELTYAIRFGQALSALNCTYEGARGLMYHIDKTELILSVQVILNSDLHKIPQISRSAYTNESKSYTQPLRLSSLFTSI